MYFLCFVLLFIDHNRASTATTTTRSVSYSSNVPYLVDYVDFYSLILSTV